jgi:hypothetical protein
MEDTPIQKPIRKRRTKQEIAAALAAAAAAAPVDDTMSGIQDAKTKGRGKKKIQPVVAIVTADGIQGSFDTFHKRPLIAHLDININDMVFYDQPLHYNPDMKDLLKEPEPYDANNEDPFVSVLEAVEETAPNSVVAPVVTTSTTGTVSTTVSTRREFGPQELLATFTDTKRTHTLPEKTDVMCYWCSHQFEGRPCIIPQACIDNIWRVYGNFCSPSCSLSYLLSQIMDTHVRWERIALLNRLYGASVSGRIYPAPPRETLATFGGTFSIQEYRNVIDEKKLRVDINYPPMVSILASMDTKPIDFYETSLKNTFVSVTHDRFHKAEEGLKLRRTKPLKDRGSTLDSCLNISIRAGGV